QLSVQLLDTPASSTEAVTAQALPLDAADLILIRGVTSGTVGVLVRKGDGNEQHTLTWPDSVVRLLPRTSDGSWEEVAAFTVGHPPVSVLRPWTDAVDTVRITFGAPIEVPFTIWTTYDFDTTAARARHDLASTDQFWRSHMTGLRVGRVT